MFSSLYVYQRTSKTEFYVLIVNVQFVYYIFTYLGPGKTFSGEGSGMAHQLRTLASNPGNPNSICGMKTTDYQKLSFDTPPHVCYDTCIHIYTINKCKSFKEPWVMEGVSVNV